MDDFTLRTVEPHESTLIFTFLTIAARMAEPDEPIQKALSDSELIKYWKDWGRPGDCGIVAESEFPISCAWVRVIPREAAAYGFVAEGIPELGIGSGPSPPHAAKASEPPFSSACSMNAAGATPESASASARPTPPSASTNASASSSSPTHKKSTASAPNRS